jgi:hypothetical protein
VLGLLFLAEVRFGVGLPRRLTVRFRVGPVRWQRVLLLVIALVSGHGGPPPVPPGGPVVGIGKVRPSLLATDAVPVWFRPRRTDGRSGMSQRRLDDPAESSCGRGRTGTLSDPAALLEAVAEL